MALIYVSSTFKDLADYRSAVGVALRRLNHQDVAMEYYVAEDMRPVERCLSDVASCDLYVGIFAFRYGHVPTKNNPEGRSITEMEYQKAGETGKDRLIFLLDEDAPWPMSRSDHGAAMEQILTFRKQLSEDSVHDHFSSVDELTRKVNEAVINWEKKSGLARARARELYDWDAYREAVCNKHQWVRLQVIAGVSKDREPLRIPLDDVFEPQLVAIGVSGIDIPDEVRKLQQAIYSPGQHAPSGEAFAIEQLEEPVREGGVNEEGLIDPQDSNPELVLSIVGREATQVILGGPGTGKSTILHYVMLRLCQPRTANESLPEHLGKATIPFLIDLRNYVLEKSNDFLEYLVRRAEDFYGASFDVESLKAVLGNEGQALVFFDGLDEVFDPDQRRKVIDQFQIFARRYSNAHIVVTSRIAGYDRTALGLAGFKHYTLLPLTLAQIRHFAGRWYRYYSLEGTERTAQGLALRIVDNPRLLDLAGNPMLLTMMAVIYRDRDLPTERWKLYDRCTETLLEAWDLGKGFEEEDFRLAVSVKTRGKSEILQRVSMYMLEHGQRDRELNAIAYDPLLKIVSDYLHEQHQKSPGDAAAIAVDILRHLMERTYVLAGVGERVFGFVHRTFMEYFAACWCKGHFNSSKTGLYWLTKEVFGKHWRGDDWREVLLLLTAMLRDQGTQVHEVVEIIRAKRPKSGPPFNVAFAALCLAEAGDIQDLSYGQALLVELTQAIEVHASKLQKTDSRSFVNAALKAFAALATLMSPPSPVREVIEHLNQVSNTRVTAWQMDFALRSRKERLDYARAALTDPEEVVRRGAIAALEREWPGRADIASALADVVRNDRNGRVRQAALASMQRSWRHDPVILNAIESRVEEETGHRGVIGLIKYLGETWEGNARARDLVMKLAAPKEEERYDNASVVIAAGKVLAAGWRGDTTALAFVQREAESNPKPSVRSELLGSLARGWGGHSQALAFMQERVGSEQEGEVRTALFHAMAEGWRGDSQASVFLQQLIVCAQDRAALVDVYSALAQGWATDSSVLALLRSTAKDPDSRTRIAVLQGCQATLKRMLFEFDGGASERLIHILLDAGTNDAQSDIRLNIIEFIIEFIFWSMPVLYLSYSKSPGLYLSYSGSPALLLIRDRAVNDEDEEVRVAALEGLWYLLRSRFHGRLLGEFDQGTADECDEDWNLLLENRPFLTRQAEEHAKPATRAKACRALALAAADRPDALRFLLDRAAMDPDPRTRLSVVQAILGSFDLDRQALEQLQDRMNHDVDLDNRSIMENLLAEYSKGSRVLQR
ncbi:DUF4062 domain-containing protein [Paraburkholderia sp. MM5482-R1]|uniref:DUF4062 domain-containing protein n=1 Tax=unclassified Paraburkholderia TaxID=2615204 RepID=UPI003D209AF0